MGGSFQDSTPTNTAEIYDPATGTWMFTGSMIKPRNFFQAILLPSGKVLVAGGSNVFSMADCELYDPVSGTWSPTGSLLQFRSAYGASLLANGKVLVSGGDDNKSGTIVAEAEIYDPSTGTWSNTGSNLLPRYLHAQVLLADGRVMVTGGIGQPTTHAPKLTGSTEIYDPATGAWSRARSLKSPRRDFSANLLRSGRVFVAGGGDGGPLTYDSIEEFNPSSGSWRTLLPLPSPRSLHTGTMLLDGSLIIAGGTDGPTRIPDAELFVRLR
jgi:N-acetylneuraminic acid mutarotase